MGGFVCSLFLFSVIHLLNYLLIYFINSVIYSIIFFFTCIHTEFNWMGSRLIENLTVYFASQLAHFISHIFQSYSTNFSYVKKKQM